MDRILRRQLQAIKADERSGAGELTRRAVESLLDWLRRSRPASPDQFLAVARQLLRTQPSMGPTFRMANLAASAAKSSSPARALAQSLLRFREAIESAPQAISRGFAKACRRKGRVRIHTYSYSSTVAASLVAARASIEWVECSESRPGLEGRRLARDLSRAGIQTHLTTDAVLLDETRHFGDLLVLGADAVMPAHLVNKVGSETLIYNFAERRRPIWVLCDTSKFRPGTPYDCSESGWTDTHGNPRDIWKAPPKQVQIRYPLLDSFPLHKSVRVLTERGMMGPARVRREIAKLKLSPRLKDLMD